MIYPSSRPLDLKGLNLGQLQGAAPFTICSKSWTLSTPCGTMDKRWGNEASKEHLKPVQRCRYVGRS